MVIEQLRIAIYDHFVRVGQAPNRAALAGFTDDELASGYQQLAAQRALELNASGQIEMAIPFSAVPTDVQVQAASVHWWANCAFDGLGIPAMLGIDAVITTHCPQSNTPISITVRDQTPQSSTCVLHMAVPLAEWWESIGDT
jgi:hypothetical protein